MIMNNLLVELEIIYLSWITSVDIIVKQYIQLIAYFYLHMNSMLEKSNKFPKIMWFTGLKLINQNTH